MKLVPPRTSTLETHEANDSIFVRRENGLAVVMVDCWSGVDHHIRDAKTRSGEGDRDITPLLYSRSMILQHLPAIDRCSSRGGAPLRDKRIGRVPDPSRGALGICRAAPDETKQKEKLAHNQAPGARLVCLRGQFNPGLHVNGR